ncbi:hypothetical protein GCM10009007_21160 [Formosimonas limnophila]|uniref:Uncharacterized protein n=1 Tax=Formosimonas limnophila TaxID=1384487 RepID=A0A8J3G0U3_9BURK|nr:hypothetical protein [Formosimonas limnophila]GHA80399.1 hypothetical protein GCM10009007_21160 [Formosimonas limnophila]
MIFKTQNIWVDWYLISSSVKSHGAREITSWLNDDIQGADSADRVINQLHEAAKLESPPYGGYLGSGNAHHWGMFKGIVYIRCEYVEEMKVAMTYEQAVSALENYKKFLLSKRTDPANPPETFEIEYQLEGDEAADFYFNKLGGRLGYTLEERKAMAKEQKRRGKK